MYGKGHYTTLPIGYLWPSLIDNPICTGERKRERQREMELKREDR